MPLPTVQLSGLCKRFGAVEAVSDVSFDVYPGEIFGLLGPNGAGKTTTIRMMLDIFRPDCGEVRLFGRKLDEAPRTASAICRRSAASTATSSSSPRWSTWRR